MKRFSVARSSGDIHSSDEGYAALASLPASAAGLRRRRA
jgi:hypothetical protein